MKHILINTLIKYINHSNTLINTSIILNLSIHLINDINQYNPLTYLINTIIFNQIQTIKINQCNTINTSIILNQSTQSTIIFNQYNTINTITLSQ